MKIQNSVQKDLVFGSPSPAADRILYYILAGRDREAVLGDLSEMIAARKESRQSAICMKIWYLNQVFRLLFIFLRLRASRNLRRLLPAVHAITGGLLGLHAVLLAAFLILFFVIGNHTRSGRLSVFPWMVAIVPFPVILTVQLRGAANRIPGTSFCQLFRVGESTVRFAALIFGTFTWVYAHFYFIAASGEFLAMIPVMTILATWSIGIAFSFLGATVLATVAGPK